MIKEQRKYCYGIYTLMFLLMCIAAFLPFFTEGKSFVWGAGVEDGLSQHFSALAYYGEALREFFRNLLAGHPKLVMWDMSLGYGADILSTLNYYAIGDPLNLLYGFVSPKNTETMYDFMILLRMYLAGITFIMYARKMKKTKLWNSDRGTGLCIQWILLPTRTAPSILHQPDDLFSIVVSWNREDLSERKTVCIYFRSLRISNEQLLFLIYADDICGDLCVDPLL